MAVNIITVSWDVIPYCVVGTVNPRLTDFQSTNLSLSTSTGNCWRTNPNLCARTWIHYSVTYYTVLLCGANNAAFKVKTLWLAYALSGLRDTGQSSTSRTNSWHTFSPRYGLVLIFQFYITIMWQMCCALKYCLCLVIWLPTSTPTGRPKHSSSGSNFPPYIGQPRVQWKNQHLII
jgi:hypothetical protein